MCAAFPQEQTPVACGACAPDLNASQKTDSILRGKLSRDEWLPVKSISMHAFYLLLPLISDQWG